jgi:hypothetical protein
MNISRKYIIIFGTLILLLVIVIGEITYYKENKQKSDQPVTNEMMETAKSASKSCLSNELENGYRVCCTIEGGIKKGLLYDCSSQEYFESEQNIYIVFDASRFDISYDPYFLHIYSDLNYEEDKPMMDSYVQDALNREEIFLMKISGTVPKDGESFVLLKLSTYPDDAFNEKDEQVILYREAKIFKE